MVSLCPRATCCLDWGPEWTQDDVEVFKAQRLLVMSDVVPVVMGMVLRHCMLNRGSSDLPTAGTSHVFYKESLLLLIALLHGGNTPVQQEVVDFLRQRLGTDEDVLVQLQSRVVMASQWWRRLAVDREQQVSISQWQSDWMVDLPLPVCARAEMRFFQLVCELHNRTHQVQALHVLLH